jgi:chorismate mutase
LKLFSKRFEIVADIWAIKKENWIQVLDENRWKEVLKKVTTKWKEFWLTEEFVIYIWEKIHKESQKIEK